MSTDAQEALIRRLARPYTGTPYELLYISKPTDTTTKFAFQHTTAATYEQAVAAIEAGRILLTTGAAAWSSGAKFSWDTHLCVHRDAVADLISRGSKRVTLKLDADTPQQYSADVVIADERHECCLCGLSGHDLP